MWSGPNHRWQSQNDEVPKVMFLAFDKKEHDLKDLTRKCKMKENNFSEKMASANKPTNAGMEPRAIPDFIALTGKRADGTSVPSKQRMINSLHGKLDESPNQTITTTPKRRASEMDTSQTCSSFGEMNSTLGWKEDEKCWADQVEESLLDNTGSDQENDKEEPAKGEPSKGKPKKNRKRKGKGASNPNASAQGKKHRTGPSWAEVAKHHICLITSDDLTKDLTHEDFLHIQNEICIKMLNLPDDLVDKCQIRKSGTRTGGIQLALEHAEGVSWYRETVPHLKPLDSASGSKYRFYGPGERPFKCFKAYSSVTTISKEKEAVKILLKKMNPVLRNGFLSVTIVSATDNLVQFRIKVGEDLVAPLAKQNNTVFFGMGTMVLTPLFGEAGHDAEEEMEVGGPQ